jgi:bifunctional ADP-heptose synthase (sugar kinase/adenylyltransferase)
MLEMQEEIADTLIGMMQTAENEGVRLKAAIFAAEMAHGVKDTKKTAPMISIEEVNVIMQQAADRHKEQILEATIVK